MKTDKIFLIFIMAGQILFSCKKEKITETKPIINELPGVGLVEKIDLNLKVSDYFFDEDSVSITPQLEILAKDGLKYSNFDYKLLTFIDNGFESKKGLFKIKSEGSHNLSVKYGNIVSNSLKVEVYDIKKLILSIKNINPKSEYFDDDSELKFEAEIRYNGVKLEFPVKISVLDLDSKTSTIIENGIFKSSKIGNFQIVANFLSITSSSINIKIIANPRRIELSYELGGSVFRSNGKSELIFKAIQLDEKNNILPLDETFKLYDNKREIDYKKTYTTKEAGLHNFKMVGQNGIRSNEINITVAPPETFTLVKIPIIIHSYGIQKTNSEVISLFEEINKIYRDEFFSSNNDISRPRDPNGVNMFVEFYPYEFDSKGNALTIKGLDYINEPTSDQWTPNQYFDKYTKENFWDPNIVVNVYVKKGLLKTQENETVNGLASLPFVDTDHPLPLLYSLPKNSTINYFNSIFIPEAGFDSKNASTWAHELGHFFGLYHVFNGNGSVSGQCTKDYDACPDTFDYDRFEYGKFVQRIISEKLPAIEVFNRINCQNNNTFVSYNIMDYSGSYNNSLTYDQRTRIRHVLKYGLKIPKNSAMNGRTNKDIKVIPTGSTIRRVLVQ